MKDAEILLFQTGFDDSPSAALLFFKIVLKWRQIVGDSVEIPALIETLLCRLESSGFAAFVVGGCVRDSLLGCTPADWDI